jgi:retron-type reverse transcriptase
VQLLLAVSRADVNQLLALSHCGMFSIRIVFVVCVEFRQYSRNYESCTRPLGIATVEDRVVQTAMKLVLDPIFEADFHPCSYGYRPQRDAKMASTAIRNDLYQGAWGVVEIDFRSYFTTIPHDKLIILIKQRVVDGSMLRLIKQSLT